MVEGSILGRLIKAIFLVIPVIASLLAILHYLDWLGTIKLMLGMGAE